MIGKCVALLAVLAQICASQRVVLANSGSCSSSAEVVLPSSGCSSSSADVVLPSYGSSSGSSSVTRNLVGRGKYPVALKNCGPTPDQQIPVITSRITAPAQEKPTVRLPASIPAPRVISHSCTCYKTILRPRVHQKIITVPVIQRYIETTHKPVIENIQYEAQPVNCGSESSGSAQLVEVGSGSVELSSGSSCGSPAIQVVQAPRVQTIEVPQIQTVEVPRVQVVEAPRVQIVEAPRLQTVELPRVQVVEAPRVQCVEAPQTFSFGSCN